MTDRRHDARVEPLGTAVVHGLGPPIVARITDLATGGVRLDLPHADAEDGWAEQAVWLELGLGGGVAGVRRWRIAGRVIRVVVPRAIVIAFDGVPADFEDMIHDQAIAALEAARNANVLIMDADVARGELVARTFVAAGCLVARTRTPLDAIVALDAANDRFWLIAIAETIPPLIAGELARFVNEIHPACRTVVIGSGGLVVNDHPDLALQVLRLVAAHDAPRAPPPEQLPEPLPEPSLEPPPELPPG